MLYYPLTPHEYPLWIKRSFKLCWILFFICLFKFPYYFALNKEVKKARNEFDNQNYSDASVYYTELSAKLPDNKCMKRYRAQALFKSDCMDDHMTALDCLQAVHLDKKEWAELLKYMPVEYVVWFHDVKKGDKVS